MNRIIKHVAFFSFQIVNTVTACFMAFFPKPFHESMFNNPERVYQTIGFSSVAVEMVHNMIRGHGAVLLAVSIFIWIEGLKSRHVYSLIAWVCALSVYAHFMTLTHHLNSPPVVRAIGHFGNLYGIIVVTAIVGLLNGVAYFMWKK